MTNLSVYKQLLGENAPYFMVFVTTMWDNKRLAGKKESEGKFEEVLKSMISKGASMERFENSQEAARRIMNKLNAKKKERDGPISQAASSSRSAKTPKSY